MFKKFAFLPRVASMPSPPCFDSKSAACLNNLALNSGKFSANILCVTIASYGFNIFLVMSNVPSKGFLAFSRLSNVRVDISTATLSPPLRLLRMVVAGWAVIKPKRSLSASFAKSIKNLPTDILLSSKSFAAFESTLDAPEALSLSISCNRSSTILGLNLYDILVNSSPSSIG